MKWRQLITDMKVWEWGQLQGANKKEKQISRHPYLYLLPNHVESHTNQAFFLGKKLKVVTTTSQVSHFFAPTCIEKEWSCTKLS